jgi:hypothetical protein
VVGVGTTSETQPPDTLTRVSTVDVVALIAVAGTLIGAFGGVILTQRYEERRHESDQDERRRTATADRLRDLYAHLADQALAMRNTAKYVASTTEPFDDEGSGADRLIAVSEKLTDNHSHLLIETAADVMRAPFSEVVESFGAFRAAMKMEQSAEQRTEIQLCAADLADKSGDLIVAARLHLDGLQTPAPTKVKKKAT